jgi:hypothetical protein
MTLQDVMQRIIDLRNSKWDAALSKPEEGQYQFTDKRYVTRKDKSVPREHHIESVRYCKENGMREYLEARDARGMQPILKNSKLYKPEGANINAEGMYQFEDAVFMMQPQIVFLEKRKADSDEGMAKAAAVENQFKQEGRAQNVEVIDF